MPGQERCSRSMADLYSQPSSMPSPSVSALQVSVWICCSTASVSRSLSSSGSVASLMPSASQSDAATTVGVDGAAAAAGVVDAAVEVVVVVGATPEPAGAGPVVTAGAIVGEPLAGVYAGLRRRASTRSWNVVATDWPLLTLRTESSLAGTFTTIFVAVAVSAFTNTARVPVALKRTVLRFLPARN